MGPLIAIVSGAILAAGALAGAPGGVATPPPVTPLAVAASPLDWTPCRGGSECAHLVVPLDHDDPTGPTISLAVLRTRTADPERRLGSLIVNPGGPGVPGRDYAAMLAFTLPTAVTGRYDIVGFDPRGTGSSSPLACLRQSQLDPWLTADATPDTAAEVRRFARLARGIGEACQERHPELLPHVGTMSTARDLDALRLALGDERLHFLGASYGTFLGSTYARLYPDRIGHLVLDGVIDPRDDQVGLTDGQIDGFDHALARMARDCARDSRCPVPGTGTRGVLRTVNRLLEDLDARPLDSRNGPPLLQQEAITGLLASTYDDASWDSAMRAVGDAVDGDGEALARMGRGFLTSGAGFLSSFLAISCVDSPAPPGPRGIGSWADLRAEGSRVPEVTRYLAWSVLPCSTWPVHADVPPGPVQAPGAAPILVIGTRHDPATPLAWARALDRQLDSGVLVVFEGDGHTALGRGSRCVDDIVTRYLARDRLPVDPTYCKS